MKMKLCASKDGKKLLMFDGCCGCEEKARHKVDGEFCGLVMFLTRLSVSVVLRLKLFFLLSTLYNAETGMGCL